jgi:hypothetical protein
MTAIPAPERFGQLARPRRGRGRAARRRRERRGQRGAAADLRAAAVLRGVPARAAAHRGRPTSPRASAGSARWPTRPARGRRSRTPAASSSTGAPDHGAAPAALLRRVDLQPRAAHLPAARAGLPRLPGRHRAGRRPPRPSSAACAEEGRQRDPRWSCRRAGHPPGQPARRRFPPGADRAELKPLAEQLRRALDDALATVDWVATGSTSPTELEHELLASTTRTTTPSRRRHRSSTAGWPSPPAEFSEHVVEHQVRTPPRCTRRWTGAATSPGRWRGTRSTPRSCRRCAHAAAPRRARRTCRNPFRSIVVRAVEVVYAVDEALRLIAEYERPRPAVRRRCRPAPASGTG